MVKESILQFLIKKGLPNCIAELAEIRNEFGECDNELRELLNEGKIDILTCKQKEIYFVKIKGCFLH